jgi:hypothetical protein
MLAVKKFISAGKSFLRFLMAMNATKSKKQISMVCDDLYGRSVTQRTISALYHIGYYMNSHVRTRESKKMNVVLISSEVAPL